jgi:hypothetical protein
MGTRSSLREWVFAFVIVAAVSAAAYLLIASQLQVSNGSSADSELLSRSEMRNSAAIIKREHGQCRQLRFDKETGAIQDSALGPCRDSDGPATNSTEGRMQAIRKAFSGR